MCKGEFLMFFGEFLNVFFMVNVVNEIFRFCRKY